MTTEELLQIMIDNQTTIIGQNDTMILNQMKLQEQNNILLSLVIVATVMVFWFKRRRTKWM